MSLTAFNRIRRMNQVEEMKPENIKKAQEKEEVKIEPAKEEIKENFTDGPLVPEVEEVKEEKPVKETKTATRRNSSKK